MIKISNQAGVKLIGGVSEDSAFARIISQLRQVKDVDMPYGIDAFWDADDQPLLAATLKDLDDTAQALQSILDDKSAGRIELDSADEVQFWNERNAALKEAQSLRSGAISKERTKFTNEIKNLNKRMSGRYFAVDTLKETQPLGVKPVGFRFSIHRKENKRAAALARVKAIRDAKAATDAALKVQGDKATANVTAKPTQPATPAKS